MHSVGRSEQKLEQKLGIEEKSLVFVLQESLKVVVLLLHINLLN